MAFTEEQEKDMLLRKLTKILEKFNRMTLAEIYTYLLGDTKTNFINDLGIMLDAERTELSEQKEFIDSTDENIKLLKKKWEKL